MPSKINVLRVKKNVAGIGRMIANALDAQEVTAGYYPKYQIADKGVVINYGRSATPVWFEDALSRNVLIINKPEAVAKSADKLLTFINLKKANVPCVEWSTNSKEVYDSLTTNYTLQWLARTLVGGSKGKGIVPIMGGTEYGPEGQPWPHAKLYTKHYEKTHEFRVHVLRQPDGSLKVIDLVQKKRMGAKKLAEKGLEKADELIRSYRRGWVFAHKDKICDLPNGGRDVIEDIAIRATEALGLDWCGVDLVAKYDHKGRLLDARVCETNTAPGIDGKTTFSRHIEGFKKLIAAHVGG